MRLHKVIVTTTKYDEVLKTMCIPAILGIAEDMATPRAYDVDQGQLHEPHKTAAQDDQAHKRDRLTQILDRIGNFEHVCGVYLVTAQLNR